MLHTSGLAASVIYSSVLGRIKSLSHLTFGVLPILHTCTRTLSASLCTWRGTQQMKEFLNKRTDLLLQVAQDSEKSGRV